MSSVERAKILAVDDEENFLRLLTHTLKIEVPGEKED